MKTIHNFICNRCSSKFETTNERKRYCGPTCSSAAKRARALELKRLRVEGLAPEPVTFIKQEVVINPYFLTRGDTLKYRCSTRGSQISGEC